MSITDIERSKKLREYGQILGRKGIHERIVEICKEVVENPEHAKASVSACGRLHAIALACKSDDYWDEKRFKGYMDEYETALEVIEKDMLENHKKEWLEQKISVSKRYLKTYDYPNNPFEDIVSTLKEKIAKYEKELKEIKYKEFAEEPIK